MVLAASDRYISYSPVVATTDFPVPFPLFELLDLRVVIGNVETSDFTVTGTKVGDRITDAVVVLGSAVTDVDVEIYGERVPSRADDFLGNSPDLASRLQTDIETVTAVQQEQRRDIQFGADARVFADAAQDSVDQAVEARNEAEQFAILAAAEISTRETVSAFGADPTGVLDSTQAFKDAILGGEGFTCDAKGLYLLSERLDITEDVFIALNGATLRWTVDALSEGISITCGPGESHVFVRDGVLETEKSGVGTALLLDFSAQISGGNISPRTTRRAYVESVIMRGATNVNTDGWLGGVDVVSGVGVTIEGCGFDGRKGATNEVAASEFAYRFGGAGNPVEFYMSKCSAYWCRDAVLADGIEGLTCTQHNFVAVGNGVRVTGSGAEPHFDISHGHINAYSFGIELNQAIRFSIANNAIFSRDDTTNDVFGVVIRPTCFSGHIGDNHFNETGTSVLTSIFNEGTRVTIGENIHHTTNGVQMSASASVTTVRTQRWESVTGFRYADGSTTSSFDLYEQYAGSLDAISTALAGIQTHVLAVGVTGVPAGIVGPGSIVTTSSWDANTAYQEIRHFGTTAVWRRQKSFGIWSAWTTPSQSFASPNVRTVNITEHSAASFWNVLPAGKELSDFWRHPSSNAIDLYRTKQRQIQRGDGVWLNFG